MEMFIGKGDNEDNKMDALIGAYKQQHDKPYVNPYTNQIIENTDGPELNFLFFELLEKSFDELLDLYIDYMSLFEIFGDFSYKVKTNLFMAVIKAKYKEGVNIS